MCIRMKHTAILKTQNLLVLVFGHVRHVLKGQQRGGGGVGGEGGDVVYRLLRGDQSCYCLLAKEKINNVY